MKTKIIYRKYNDGGNSPIPYKPDYKSPLDSVIDVLMSQPEYKGKDKKYFTDALDKIAYTESLDKNVKQVKGPAEGYFQIEPDTRKTGYKRLNNFNKKYNTNIIIPKVKDSRNLSREDQAALTLINLTRGGYSLPDFKDTKNVWLNRHWAGPKKDKEIRSKHYDSAMNEMKRKAVDKPYTGLMSKIIEKYDNKLEKPKSTL